MYDERFPGAPFMVSKSGLTIEHFGNENRRNNTDKEMFPPEDLLPPPSKTGPVDIGATTFPAAGFDIHVIFKYDNNFWLNLELMLRVELMLLLVTPTFFSNFQLWMPK